MMGTLGQPSVNMDSSSRDFPGPTEATADLFMIFEDIWSIDDGLLLDIDGLSSV